MDVLLFLMELRMKLCFKSTMMCLDIQHDCSFITSHIIPFPLSIIHPSIQQSINQTQFLSFSKTYNPFEVCFECWTTEMLWVSCFQIQSNKHRMGIQEVKEMDNHLKRIRMEENCNEYHHQNKNQPSFSCLPHLGPNRHTIQVFVDCPLGWFHTLLDDQPG